MAQSKKNIIIGIIVVAVSVILVAAGYAINTALNNAESITDTSELEEMAANNTVENDIKTVPIMAFQAFYSPQRTSYKYSLSQAFDINALKDSIIAKDISTNFAESDIVPLNSLSSCDDVEAEIINKTDNGYDMTVTVSYTVEENGAKLHKIQSFNITTDKDGVITSIEFG